MLSSRDSSLTAQTLRKARLEAGLTLRELAQRASTSHATLSAYENNAKVPSAEVFFRILEAAGFGIDLRLSKRVRHNDGIARGEELQQVLDLAGQFPVKASKRLTYPQLRKVVGSH
ncbi:MAG: helix-turn-helix transcriptional regulator [Pseudomonadota bacterium]